MERGSPSRHSWADEVEEAESLHRSPSSLNPDAEPFSPAALGAGERLSFTDSEASYDSEEHSPAAVGKGKVPVQVGPRRKRLRRRRRRRLQRQGGFMADARRTYREDAAAPLRLRSIVVHPARFSQEPDSDGFRQAHSRRRWRRRASPTLPKPVPADLVGLCFNCLGDDHVKKDCTYPSRCRTCRCEGHRARYCPWGMGAMAGAKRGCSPAAFAGRRGTFRRRVSLDRWRAPSGDTVSARSRSTGRSPSVPRCCAPPSPEAPAVVQQPFAHDVAASGDRVEVVEGQRVSVHAASHSPQEHKTNLKS
jgi:hypothetical protein